MARYTEAVCRQCRREGVKLYLKGDRCYGSKCAFEVRAYAPGQHGQARKKVSEYGIQLREKQKARRIYGMLERQFHNCFERAEKQKGITGENLLIMLERRMDNVVYRLGLADSRSQARQLVTHGHISVNGERLDIPSAVVKAGDVISVMENSRGLEYFKGMAETLAKKTVPVWLVGDAQNLGGKVDRFPTREEIDLPIEEHLIVELYSK
ncbi:30S ribosomal protein S4 [bioreactor metagenome]|uniref:30S ribosomal protein S4 n=1 Tax=bioreactor metagenome TaxID=1076179 RepID=A0A644W157_9ZZZZ|nr:30S ribosomal protein S4 [Acidaminococcaceae bacterium]